MACLFLLNSLTVGGSEKKSVRLAHALSDRGHDVHIAFLSEPDDLKKEIKDNIPVLYLERRGKFDLKALSRLTRYLADRSIDTVFCMNLYPYLYARAARFRAPRSDIQCLAFINITDFLLVKEKLQMAIYWPLLRSSTKLVFGCKAQQEQWSDRYFLPRDKSTVIYNGVDCSFFSPQALSADPATLRRGFGFSHSDFIITVVADLRPEKAHSDMLMACKALYSAGHPVRLLLVGDGPERASLETRTTALGLTDRVHFLGNQPDVRPAIGVSDVFALSSVAVETFSNAALEAMAMAKPVVLSDIGGAAEMVFPGENGYLFPPSDTKTLVAILEELIHRPGLCATMGQKARTVAMENFGFEHMADQYESFLRPPEANAQAPESLGSRPSP